MITEPRISIDRGSKAWAIFDSNFKCVKEFEDYVDEGDAKTKALEWLKGKTEDTPCFIYPQITSIKMSYRKRK